MKRQILALTLVFAMLFSFGIGSSQVSAEKRIPEQAAGTTYYVSSINGNNDNDGTSEAKAFFSLDKINAIELQPGDHVLLESGSVFINGFLHIKGSGNAEHPIIIDKYGEGNDPYIMTNGEGLWYQDYGKPLDSSGHKLKGWVSSSIHLFDVEYIEISNIEMSNIPSEEEVYNALDTTNRTGVSAVARNIGTVDHIVLKNLNIHDIIGNVYDKHMNNGGIYFTCALPEDITEAGYSETGVSKYDDVLIENCTIDNVNRWGLAIGYTAYWDKFTSTYISDEVCETYGSTNVVIRNNFINEPGGDSITTMYCFRPLVESNVSSGAARQINPIDYSATGSGRVAAAVWAWKCKDSIFQYNEVYDTYLNQDGQAWDADYGDGLIYQYNYSHNNGGGALMICGYQAVNTIFRYNISQNDLGGVMNPAGAPVAQIYNNVFYVKENVPFIRPNMAGGVMVVENNIIYYAGATALTEQWTRQNTKATYSNNVYYNYANIPADKFAITDDPMFVNPGSAPTTTDGTLSAPGSFDGYKLQAESPAIDAGKAIANNGGVDFFGNTIDKKPDIGVHDAGTYFTSFDSSINDTPYDLAGNVVLVPSLEKNPTSVTEFLSNITVEKNATKKLTKDGATVTRGVIDDKMILVITAEDNSTTDYAITIKNQYVYTEDYSTTAQGNLWFYQQKANDVYTNLAAVDIYDGWVTSTTNDYATVATDKKDGATVGLLCDALPKNLQKQGMSMAWRAPKSGEVELSFANAAAYLRQASSGNQNAGGQVEITITKNGSAVSDTLTIPNNGAHLTMNPVTVEVEQGDYVRVEVFNNMTDVRMTRPSVHISPIITYQNKGDSEAPTSPANLTASMIQPKQATLVWDASTDNVGVEGYKVYFNGELVANSVDNKIIFKGLTANKNYAVSVVGYDLAGNESVASTTSFTTSSTDFIYSNDKELTISEPVSLPSLVDKTKNLDTITIGAHFKQTSDSIGSIISFAKTDTAANHFHLYANADTIGYELRGLTSGSSISSKVAGVLTAMGENKVVLKANPADYTFKLFVNGELVDTKTLTVATYAMIKDMASTIDAVTIGKTPRSGSLNEYLFNGVIYDISVFSGAISDNILTSYTAADIITLESDEPVEPVEPADKEDLGAVIIYALEQKASAEYAHVVPAVKAAFEAAISDAQAVFANENATQTAVDKAYDDLLEMVQMLSFTGNPADLKALVELAEAINLALYTDSSANAVTDAVAAAKVILDDENSLQADIDEAKEALQSAIDALVLKPIVDKSALERKIAEGDKIDLEKYLAQGQDAFKTALENAKTVRDDANATQAEVKKAHNDLRDAIFKLRLKPDKSKLEELINKAKNIDTDKYTKNSVAALNSAVAKANDVVSNENSAANEVLAAENSVKKALNGLVLLSGGGETTTTTDKNTTTTTTDKNTTKTGESKTILPSLVVMISAAMLTAIAIVRVRKKKIR